MPNRLPLTPSSTAAPTVRRNSVVEQLAKVPVNRGSLIKSIENLLKTIESSESAVMIPTLLRDKCEFDAWELLFVAKILKASILGHSDLVEFYMNHIGHSSSQFASNSSQNQPQSPSTIRLASPGQANSNGIVQTQGSTDLGSNGTDSPTGALSTSSSSTGGSSTGNNQSSNKPSSQTSWATAISTSNTVANGNQFSSSSSVSGNSVGSSTYTDTNQMIPESLDQAPTFEQCLAAANARPSIMRQVQTPPSLLQLTTNNNHLNSISTSSSATNCTVANVGFTNDNIEQLTNQLEAMQASLASGGQEVSGSLSISTAMSNGLSMNPQQSSANVTPTSSTPTNAGPTRPDSLKTSRSAGCLFRNNSGASSPRTPNGYINPGSTQTAPTTPYPQAETLTSMGLTANGLLQGDPSAPVKLLLQIEQLKSSISHVTRLLESVVELYKKSIDNLALA